MVLGDGTVLLNGRTLSYDLPVEGTTLTASTRLATGAVLE